MPGFYRRKCKKLVLVGLILVSFVILVYRWQLICNVNETLSFTRPEGLVHVESGGQIDRKSPLIFIGGMPRSGTTLMRAMLDAHPDVRCGQETRVIPRILQMRQHWVKSVKEKMRLNEAGVTAEVVNNAVSAFILEVIARHGEMAPRLCNKDPLTMKYSDYVVELFPNSKFLFMVRDGRATVHSIISRKVSITGFNLNDYGQCLKKWNDAISTMYRKCRLVGNDKCLLVYYEQLVLHPTFWMKKILDFLDLPWNDAVLHHDTMIDKPGGIVLSKVEKSSDQVIKPVNLEALTRWVGQFPEDVLMDADSIAPMLRLLGYDPSDNSADYGLPDEDVNSNTNAIMRRKEYWRKKSENIIKEAESIMSGLAANENEMAKNGSGT